MFESKDHQGLFQRMPNQYIECQKFSNVYNNFQECLLTKPISKITKLILTNKTNRYILLMQAKERDGL